MWDETTSRVLLCQSVRATEQSGWWTIRSSSLRRQKVACGGFEQREHGRLALLGAACSLVQITVTDAYRSRCCSR
jgi:hypothetical protein